MFLTVCRRREPLACSSYPLCSSCSSYPTPFSLCSFRNSGRHLRATVEAPRPLLSAAQQGHLICYAHPLSMCSFPNNHRKIQHKLVQDMVSLPGLQDRLCHSCRSASLSDLMLSFQDGLDDGPGHCKYVQGDGTGLSFLKRQCVLQRPYYQTSQQFSASLGKQGMVENIVTFVIISIYLQYASSCIVYFVIIVSNLLLEM